MPDYFRMLEFQARVEECFEEQGRSRQAEANEEERDLERALRTALPLAPRLCAAEDRDGYVLTPMSFFLGGGGGLC